MDRAADDAGPFKVLDVAQATQIAALVVAEAVEAVDGVAVLENGDPAAVELLVIVWVFFGRIEKKTELEF